MKEFIVRPQYFFENSINGVSKDFYWARVRSDTDEAIKLHNWFYKDASGFLSRIEKIRRIRKSTTDTWSYCWHFDKKNFGMLIDIVPDGFLSFIGI